MDKKSFIFILALSIALFFVNVWILPPVAAPQVVEAVSLQQNPAERFYVLENATQQIVFSNFGGAIKEINLPFQTGKDTESIVRPIEFDREIEKESPQNALYPLIPATFFDKRTETIEPYAPQKGGYTPLLRRSVKNKTTGFSFLVAPKFYMGQLVNQEGEYEGETFQMTKLTADSIEFSGTINGQKVVKNYQLVSPYGFQLSVSLKNASTKALYLTNGISEVELISGAYDPKIQTLQVRGEKTYLEKIDLPSKDVGDYPSENSLWISSSNGFFGTILNPDSSTAQPGFLTRKIEGENCPTRLHLIDQKYDLYPVKSYPAYQVCKQMNPQNGTFTFRFYAGPYEEKMLTLAQENYPQNPQFAQAQAVQGWFSFISAPFVRLMFFIMKICYAFTNSWGVSIMGFTLVLRLLTSPLNNYSTKAMQAQAQIQPEIKALEARYKKDPTKLRSEIMKLYSEKKINPLMGCLPNLIQIPFLIGIFDLLKTNFELRGVPFLITSWIPNLAAPDILFSWGYPLPFIGNEFHLLPIITGLIMFVQTKLSSPTMTAATEESQRQAATMQMIMPVMLTLFFYNLAAGLNIYFAFSTFLGVAQQFLMMKISQKSKIQSLKK